MIFYFFKYCRFLEIDHFDYGCELSIYVSECKSGPYIPVCESKYFPRKKVKRIPISSLPCRYILILFLVRFLKIICTKGVHINVKNIKLIGARSEDIASLDD